MRKFFPILLFAGCCYGQVTVSGTGSISGNVVLCSTSATCATPTASPTPGTYSSTQSVTLSTSTGGATICYTTDGTTPTATTPGTCLHGTTYSTAISVSTTTTIKAIATESSFANSAVFSGTYTITGAGAATPVLGPFVIPNMVGNNANFKPSPTLTFGKQGTGTSSMAVPISISNCSKTTLSTGQPLISACTGSGTLTVSSMTITGTNAADFVLAGTCSTITSGSDCEPTVTFTPTQSSGTAESATLTISYSGATVANQTISLTGTSATVTTESGCFTASNNTNYQLTGDISAAGTSAATESCIINNATNVDFNLNGHKITWCTGGLPQVLITAYSVSGTTVTLTANNSFISGQTVHINVYAGPTFLSATTAYTVLSGGLSSTQFEITASGGSGSGSASGIVGNGVLAGGIFTNGFGEYNDTVHNGQIAEASGKYCTGMDSTGIMGSSDFGVSSTGSSSGTGGDSFFNLTLSQNDAPGHVIAEEVGGSGSPIGAINIHDVSYTMNGAFNCPSGDVGCRAENQFYPIWIDAANNLPASDWYNIGGTGGTQGGLTPQAPGSTIEYTLISPGSTVATNTNGFAYQIGASNVTMSNNLVVGSGSGGSCPSCRPVQIGAVGGTATTGVVSENNTLFFTYLANNDEYSGCPGGGAYGYQLNTAGSGQDLSNITIRNNYVRGISTVCGCSAMVFANATKAAGPNQTVNNHFECDLAPGSSAYPNTGINLESMEYSPHPDGALIATGETYLGDTSAVYQNVSASWTCNQCTFGKGTNPSASWVFYDYFNGLNVGASDASPDYFVDPVFTAGSCTSNNLSTWATNNSSLTFGYFCQYTYTVTVEKSSNSAPITGATVAITDAQSGTYSGTTNSSGVAVLVLNSLEPKATTGSYSVVNFNPMGIIISASGCTTGSYSESITTTTTETKKLSGC